MKMSVDQNLAVAQDCASAATRRPEAGGYVEPSEIVPNVSYASSRRGLAKFGDRAFRRPYRRRVKIVMERSANAAASVRPLSYYDGTRRATAVSQGGQRLL